MKLFMVEILVSDWSRAVAWYTDTLGLSLVLRDDPNRFALLEAGGAKIALKAAPVAEPARCRLVFQVNDVDDERARLQGRGVLIGEPIDNTKEQYREVRLQGPEKIPIHLFSWTHQA